MITLNIFWKNANYTPRFNEIPSAIQIFSNERAMEMCIGRWMENGGVWIREGSEDGPLLMAFPWSMVHHVEVVRPTPEAPPPPPPEFDLNPYRGGM